MLFSRAPDRLSLFYWREWKEGRASIENHLGQKTVSCIATLEVMVFPTRWNTKRCKLAITPCRSASYVCESTVHVWHSWNTKLMWSNAIHETIRGGGPKFFSLIYKCLFCSPTLSTMMLYVQMTEKKKESCSKHFSGTEDFLVKTNKKSKKTKKKGKKKLVKKVGEEG